MRRYRQINGRSGHRRSALAARTQPQFDSNSQHRTRFRVARDTRPIALQGTRVNAFAKDLDPHPRWVVVLPNGDVLVAESNAPPKPEDAQGIKGWVMKLVMKRAGASTPSANRITLLRDTNQDGVADVRTVFASGLNSPFGMALVGNELYVANTDAIVKFAANNGTNRAHRTGQRGAGVTRWAHQPPLDEKPDRQPRRAPAVCHGGVQQQRGRAGHAS